MPAGTEKGELLTAGTGLNSEVTLVWAEATANRLAALSTQTLCVREERFYFTWTGSQLRQEDESEGAQKKAVSCCKHREAAQRVREERSGRTGTFAKKKK